MKYTVFDVETTGLPEKGQNWETDYNLFPRIISIAWSTISPYDEFSPSNNYYIIELDDWLIPEESTKIHGITNQQSLAEGVLLSEVLPKFIKACLNSDKIIGHNIYFDTSIIKSEVLRMNNAPFTEDAINALHKDKRIDTMMKTIKFCNIKQKDSNRLKFPSLVELYYKLFNETFEAHNAYYDVKATNRCLIKLIELGII